MGNKPSAEAISHEELAALNVFVYGDLNQDLPGHMKQRGWRLTASNVRDDIGFCSATFSQGNIQVIVVRGTDNLANLYDDATLYFNGLPDIIRPLKSQIKDVLSLGKSCPRLFLTGHSLGASAVNAAVLGLAVEDASQFVNWMDKIESIVLFENPGVREDLIGEAQVQLGSDTFKALSEKMVQYFGAPNAINTCQHHMAGDLRRVKIPHEQKRDFTYVARCILDSAGRILNFVPFANAAAAGVATAEVAKAGLVACRIARGVGAFRSALGVSDIAAWTIRQHSMEKMHAMFDECCDQPRADSWVAVCMWPSAVALKSHVKAVLISQVPFHPANTGLHTIHDPDEVVEKRIQWFFDYEEVQIAEE